MEMPILVEPIASGFRATCLSIAELSTEAVTEGEALQQLRERITAKLTGGAKIVGLRVTDSDFQAAWDRLKNDPTWDEFQAAIRANRLKDDAELAAEYGSPE